MCCNFIPYARSIADAYALAFAFADSIADPYAISSAYAKLNLYYISDFCAEALKVFIEYIRWSKKFQIYRAVNYSQLIDTLEVLKYQIPKDKEAQEVHRAFSQRIIQTWLEAFQITHNRIFFYSLEQKALDNYLYANLLMVECKKAAVRVSRETWSGIESRMLLQVRN